MSYNEWHGCIDTEEVDGPKWENLPLQQSKGENVLPSKRGMERIKENGKRYCQQGFTHHFVVYL